MGPIQFLKPSCWYAYHLNNTSRNIADFSDRTAGLAYVQRHRVAGIALRPVDATFHHVLSSLLKLGEESMACLLLNGMIEELDLLYSAA